MILLLHGALGAAASMQALQERLRAQGADVHALDFSGHGQAAWPERGFSLEAFEEDVLRYMDDNGIAAAHLFGYSMGGFVALRLALHAPARILSLSTLATKMDWTEAGCARESAMLHPEKMEAKVPQFAAALDAMHCRNDWREVVNETRSLIGKMHHYRIGEEALAGIQQPACIMLGDRDAMVSLEETEALYRTLPKASLAVLPSTPHPLERVNPDMLAGLLGRHLQAHGALPG
jgi:pimeloyl-ACP methyl ester carboxylesterase